MLAARGLGLRWVRLSATCELITGHSRPAAACSLTRFGLEIGEWSLSNNSTLAHGPYYLTCSCDLFTATGCGRRDAARGFGTSSVSLFSPAWLLPQTPAEEP